MKNKFLCLVKFVIGLSFVVGASATALGEEFYKGKIIRFIVSFGPGGGYDTYTRAVARHIGKYIPGNPTPIVLNMSGGGGLVAAHYIYNSAKPDGLTVGVWNSAHVLRQALGDRSVKFKGDKFGWIGAPGRGIRHLYPGCCTAYQQVHPRQFHPDRAEHDWGGQPYCRKLHLQQSQTGRPNCGDLE